VSLLRWLFNRGKNKSKEPPGPKIVELEEREPVHVFQTHLAGDDLQNPDGSQRQDIIARNEVGAETILMEHRGTMGLVAVHVAATGEQIGFLPREISRKIKKEARGYDYRTLIDDIGEPDPETGIRRPSLTIEVYEKRKQR